MERILNGYTRVEMKRQWAEMIRLLIRRVSLHVLTENVVSLSSQRDWYENW